MTYDDAWVAAEEAKRAWLDANGLYRSEDEHSSCGVGLVVSISGRPSRKVVENGINALKAVWHRGAVDADGKTGDGAGIHVQIPVRFFYDQVEIPGVDAAGQKLRKARRIGWRGVQSLFDRVIAFNPLRFAVDARVKERPLLIDVHAPLIARRIRAAGVEMRHPAGLGLHSHEDVAAFRRFPDPGQRGGGKGQAGKDQKLSHLRFTSDQVTYPDV